MESEPPALDTTQVSRPNTDNIATMTAAELEQHIKALDKTHKALMKELRALLGLAIQEEGNSE